MAADGLAREPCRLKRGTAPFGYLYATDCTRTRAGSAAFPVRSDDGVRPSKQRRTSSHLAGRTETVVLVPLIGVALALLVAVRKEVWRRRGDGRTVDEEMEEHPGRARDSTCSVCTECARLRRGTDVVIEVASGSRQVQQVAYTDSPPTPSATRTSSKRSQRMRSGA